MRVKICGITKPDQGKAITELGATTLGFICVQSSPRFITPQDIQAVIELLPITVERIGVFANASLEEIRQTLTEAELTGIQLHGNETVEFCDRLRQLFPHLEIIKAIRVKTPEALLLAETYIHHVDSLLLDAYHPQQLGGTGHTLDWNSLQQFRPAVPWLLAGGLTPDNVLEALNLLKPDGIDLSSGVEQSPGDKDLAKVRQLFKVLSEN
ncbi:N-(5'phosphoribosyl)anthranilate (PRA) isomerase family protein [Lyngbya aestuarii BL J]|uniref:N-(5'-phosphoribosyl)anthranilate isomerase n=1 Tax=Lyngbya aestuarii BL J TaxID=1348334 RepID=U7QT47_9CYAN|nr:phosphoribosylanthranilate isomerase [Lyngbya aestuarii]ERT09596.1 N-(5'phosphoribosyl)anthranilate (PRA) isomerase family protein [Lyngbya aestuarii BL J]